MYYLIFTGGEENELFDDMFADLRERENMRCIPDVPQVAGALRPLYRLHHARSLNRKRPLPFRGIWSDRRLSELVAREAKEHPELTLFFNNFSISHFEPSQLAALQKRYGCRLWLCYIDRMSSYCAEVARMYESRLHFDRVLSYYRADAERHGKEYFDCYYSRPLLPDAGEHCELYFWGSDTGRRPMLEQVYRHVTGLGHDCRMGICYAQGDGERLKGIRYDEPKTYPEVLRDVAGAEILLDLICGEGGVSLRFYEAVVFGKKLISNNPEIRRMRLYDPESMLLIEKPEDITEEFLAKKITPRPYKDEFSPLGLFPPGERG